MFGIKCRNRVLGPIILVFNITSEHYLLISSDTIVSSYACSVRTPISMKFFPRFFLLYFLVFHIYFFSYTYGNIVISHQIITLSKSLLFSDMPLLCACRVFLFSSLNFRSIYATPYPLFLEQIWGTAASVSTCCM